MFKKLLAALQAMFVPRTEKPEARTPSEPASPPATPSGVKMPRGFRNNNPGNIRHSGAAWRGKSKHQPDTAFVTFDSPMWGIRAMMRVLLTYQEKHGLTTIAELIGRWAPPNENDTAAYVRYVAGRTGIAANMTINLRRRPHIFIRVVQAIVVMELGTPPKSMGEWYPLEVYNQAFENI